MKELLSVIEKDKRPVLNKLGVARLHKETINLTVMPDYNITSYGGLDDKEYYIHESHGFRDDYIRLFDASLKDYGYKVEGEECLYRETSGSGEGRLTYDVERIDLRKMEVYFKGGLYGSEFEIGGDNLDTRALLEVYGLKKNDISENAIFQDLIGEGYLLELEGNFRMSFFSYFTCIDSYINAKIDKIKRLIYSELGNALQMLRLEDKIRICGKYSYQTDKIGEVKLWEQLISLFKELARNRNRIAHGQSIPVDKALCDRCFLCGSAICASFDHNIQSFKDIRKYYYER